MDDRTSTLDSRLATRSPELHLHRPYTAAGALSFVKLPHTPSKFVSYQEAVALGFETETARLGQLDCYFSTLPTELIAKRDKLASMLREVGMKPVVPQGSYFMLADVSQLKQSRNLI